MADPDLVRIEPSAAMWDRFFLVAPLTVVGTREPDGSHDLAPKHMVTPLSWEDHWGFVCTESHATYRNAKREGAFTVSFPRPSQVLQASLAAAPRCDDDDKPALSALPTIRASRVDGVILADSYLAFECRLERVVEDLGPNALIVGRIELAHVARDALRDPEIDDQDLLAGAPLLAYVSPGRFAEIGVTQAFPFHEGWSR